jgi:hypothetical protein
MEEYKRNSVIMQLDDYCIMSKEHDYIEVTEWSNGEGFDVMMEGDRLERFSLTSGQFKALKKAVKHLKNTNI